jgi:opacity protein-like surface antigen
MKRLVFAAAAALAAATPALAQESLGDDYLRLSWIVPGEILPAGTAGEPDAEALAEGEGMKGMSFMLGARVGYMQGKDADKGNWLGGVQARLYIVEFLAVEGSIEFHQDEYLDGDATLTFYPVQVSTLLSPFTQWPVRPYVLGGAGWYYTRIDYHDALETLDSETDHFFGFHVGGGAELSLGKSLVLSADFRYVFVDEPGVDNSQIENEDWDYWEITGGINFRM